MNDLPASGPNRRSKVLQRAGLLARWLLYVAHLFGLVLFGWGVGLMAKAKTGEFNGMFVAPSVFVAPFLLVSSVILLLILIVLGCKAFRHRDSLTPLRTTELCVLFALTAASAVVLVKGHQLLGIAVEFWKHPHA